MKSKIVLLILSFFIFLSSVDASVFDNKIDAKSLSEKLPKLDCGSCGSPTCYCLAEDIVMGYTNEDSCIVRFKEKIVSLAKSIETAEKIDITE